MVKIQIDLTDEIDNWLAHKSIDLSFHDKRMVIIKILKEVMNNETNNKQKR